MSKLFGFAGMLSDFSFLADRSAYRAISVDPVVDQICGFNSLDYFRCYLHGFRFFI